MFYTHSRCLPQRLASTDVLETPKKLHFRLLTQALLMLLIVLALPNNVSGQDLELHAGYVHVTQNFGTNGVNGGAAWWFTKRVTAAADYDSTWNNSTIGTIAPIGTIVSKIHLQNALFGTRIFFPFKQIEKYRFHPFGEAQFGFSHIGTTLRQAPVSVSSSDTSFSWMLGGGVEYRFDPNWSGRVNLDFLRTHFVNQAQSRFRLVLGVTYTFGARESKPKPTKEKK
jgi:Outer membrane protein beta-barrel domain